MDRARGQALVEFALIFPIFILLLFGLMDIGRLVFQYNALNQGSREAARVGSVAGFTQDCSGVTSRTQCIQQIAISRIAATPGVTVASNCSHQTGSGVVSVAADSCLPGDTLVVTLTAPFSLLTPVIGQLLGQGTLTGQATVIVNS
jgi:Flp pilus assembly protein TadG